MKSWYRTIREDELKDGSIRKVYHLVFETDDKNIVEKVEQFFCDVMDAKTENSSEKPNSCEDLQDWKDRMWAEAIVTEPTISKMEQVDKDINVRSKDEPQTENLFIDKDGDVWEWRGDAWYCISGQDEPQTETEIAKAIVHKMIDDAVIAEDAYPDLRQKMHDAVDEYEPLTDCAWR